MQVLNSVDPPGDLFGFLVGAFDPVNIDGGGTHDVLALHVLQLKHSLVLRVECRFIQLSNTQVLLGAIRLGHLEEGVNFADRGDVVRHEGAQLSFKVDLLGLVAGDVLEQFLHLGAHVQVRVLRRVVRSRHFLLVARVFLFVVASSVCRLGVVAGVRLAGGGGLVLLAGRLRV